MNTLYSVAAIGDAGDPSTFSGIPYHFYAAAKEQGMNFLPWRMDLSTVNFDRKLWNAMKLIQLQLPGGYQYSKRFSDKVISQIPSDLLQTSVISFNQHFPPADVICRNGGKVYHYIDATFTQLLDRYGIPKNISKQTKSEVLKREKDFFQSAELIFTMQQWAKDSVVKDYGIAERKVKVVLPGANILFESTYKTSALKVRAFSKDRPLVLGFVGKDWERKGLLVLAQVRDILEQRGWPVIIRCAGYAPEEFKHRKGVEFVGFIQKYADYSQFIKFLESCDIGCLFSQAEFSSISVLEFISVGRPVAGFVVDGMGDLFMPELSIRHNPTDSVEHIADSFEKFLSNEVYRDEMNHAAVNKSEYVRWKRSLNTVMEYIKN